MGVYEFSQVALENASLLMFYQTTLRHKRSPSKTAIRSKGLVIYLSQRMGELSNHLVRFHVLHIKKN